MKLTTASSPHIRGNFSTRRIMLDVVLALLPALIVGVAVLGWRSLVVAVLCVASAVAAEWLFCLVTRHRNTVADGSALELDVGRSYISIIGEKFPIEYK